MSKLLLAFATAVLYFALTPSAAYAISGPAAPTSIIIDDEDNVVASTKLGLSKRELRKQVRQQRKAAKAQLKAAAAANDTELILLIILTIIPLLAGVAMYIYEGDFTTRVLISAVLSLLYLPGIIYNLIVFLSEN